MKKIIVGLILIFLAIALLPLNHSYATTRGTLGDARRQLRELEAQYQASRNQRALTQSEIATAQRNIRNSQAEIDRNRNEIEQAKIEIEELNEEIARTEDIIRELIRAQQFSTSGNMALEFIFQADSYADLIERFALQQQIATFKTILIDDFNENILRLEELQERLRARERDLERAITRLNTEIERLGLRLETIEKGAVDIRADIAARRETIRAFEQLGCRDNEDMPACMLRLFPPPPPNSPGGPGTITGPGTVGPGRNGFHRPMNSGTVTSPFGWRNNPLGSGTSFHAGIDIGGVPEGTPIFAVANGTVGRIVHRASCGGNIVYIWHNVNGRMYTSEYMHLLAINVRVGQQVTPRTQIGTMGGGRQTPWDRCSTGPHLHFGLATGWYGAVCAVGCYTSWSTFRANILDPRSRIDLPGRGGRFSGPR